MVSGSSTGGSSPSSGAQTTEVVDEFCGVGAPTVKSAALLSVSTHTSVRATEVELSVASAGPPSAVVAEPQPSRSAT